MMALALVTLSIVVGPSPRAGADRTAGPFVEGLPGEFRTSPAPVNPTALAAALGHRRNAGIAGQTVGRCETITPRADRRNQTRLERRTSSRKRRHQRAIRVRAIDLADLPVKFRNAVL